MITGGSLPINSNIETSHAILRFAGKYILQLRDDRPDIADSGKWSLFGGRINVGETPLEAIKREIFEELSIRPHEFKFLWQTDYYYDFVKDTVRTWFFVSNVDDVWGAHRLEEGSAVDIFSFPELKGLDIPDVIRQALHRYHSEEGGL